MNYGQTQKRSFANSYKVLECNTQNIPRLEFKVSDSESCVQLQRRIICGRVGYSTYVKDPALVDEENGAFPFIP